MGVEVSQSVRGSADAFADAVVGVVTPRGDDPIVPFQFLEADVEGLFAAGRAILVARYDVPTQSAARRRLGGDDQEWTEVLVTVAARFAPSDKYGVGRPVVVVMSSSAEEGHDGDATDVAVDQQA